jgi:hypothetical protein
MRSPKNASIWIPAWTLLERPSTYHVAVQSARHRRQSWLEQSGDFASSVVVALSNSRVRTRGRAQLTSSESHSDRAT